MPLTLPNLDDRSWEELVAEGRSLIPSWAPEWTNYNAADPGITLIELFAYLTEMLLYRSNQVADENVRAFLRLINGPQWNTGASLKSDKLRTLTNRLRIRRAVTAKDFELLATAVNEDIETGQKVARAKCIPRSDLEGARDSTSFDRPGHVTIVIVPDNRAEPEPGLLQRVKDQLDESRLLTTRVHVVHPSYISVVVRLTAKPARDAIAENVRTHLVNQLQSFFDPLLGGIEGHGWPFGRSIYVSEIYDRVTNVAGVDDARILELVVIPSEAWRLSRNHLGQIEAVTLRQDELVAAGLEVSLYGLT